MASRSSSSGSSSSEKDTLPHLSSRGGGADRAPAAAAAPAPAPDAGGSPFIGLDHPITLYEGTKLVLMLPVVLVKLILICFVVVLAWSGVCLLMLGFQPTGPMHPARAFLIRQWVTFWARFVLFVGGFYYIPVKGWGNLQAARQCRAILVFNHDSYVDAVSTIVILEGSSVAKSGVARIPLVGRVCVALQLVFVQRRNSRDPKLGEQLAPDVDPVEAIARRVADPRYPPVIISPEGTTKDTPCLLKFQRGAFAAGLPVCPVLVRYRFKHFNPGWGIQITPLHFYRLLAQFVNYQSIEVLPPFFPSLEERRDPAVYAQNVRELMGSALGVPLIDQGLDEWRGLVKRGVRPNWRGTGVVVSPPRKKEDTHKRKKAE